MGKFLHVLMGTQNDNGTPIRQIEHDEFPKSKLIRLEIVESRNSKMVALN